MKNHIEKETFYQEANDMSPGWGKYLKKIDILKNKVEKGDFLVVKEFCYILWAERFVNSDVYLKFKRHVNRKYPKLKMPLPAWYGLWESWEFKNKPEHMIELETETFKKALKNFVCECRGNWRNLEKLLK
jgi:hypothetical protein